MSQRRHKERRAPEALKSSVEVTPEIAPGESPRWSTRSQRLRLQSALVPIQVEPETMNPGPCEFLTRAPRAVKTNHHFKTNFANTNFPSGTLKVPEVAWRKLRI